MSLSCEHGATAEAVAEKYQVTREEADQFATDPTNWQGRAIEQGSFASSILPVDVTEVMVENNRRIEKDFSVSVDDGEA